MSRAVTNRAVTNPFASVRPIVSALRGHRAAVILMALEIALTLAVLCNLVFIVVGTSQRARTPTGVDEGDIGLIQSIGVIGENDGDSSAGRSLSVLQAVPGVVAAAYGSPPLWGTSQQPLFLDQAAKQPAARGYLFSGSQGLNRTLGVRVVEGRDLRDDELPSVLDVIGERTTPAQMPALITPSLAARLFPGDSPLGRTLYINFWGNTQAALRIVGVMAPVRGQITGRDDDADALLTEFKVAGEGLGGGYVVRSGPGQLGQVLPLAAAAMQKANPSYVQQKVQPLAELRADYFRSDRALARMLTAIIAILLAVTALGIVGLASFWVQQRVRQIGVRRALGATRGDILRYFHIENFLIVGGAVLPGILLALAINQLLMSKYELPRLPWEYLVAGAAVLCVLGQASVLWPARRAAGVPPAIATRGA